jgi:hypothetical protein
LVHTRSDRLGLGLGALDNDLIMDVQDDAIELAQ